MFMKMAESQSNVVNALLDEIDRSDWSRAYVYAEFAPNDSPMTQLCEGFLIVPDAAGPSLVSLRIEYALSDALTAMHKMYAEAGHGFWRLDLVVERSSAYRFQLDDTPSLFLA